MSEMFTDTSDSLSPELELEMAATRSMRSIGAIACHMMKKQSVAEQK